MPETAERDTFTLPADHALHRVQRVAGLVGVVAAGFCVVGLLFDREQFFRSYLVAYLLFIGIALGNLAILMLQYLTGGAWGASIRRLLESGTRTLPLLAVLFLPIVVGIPALYEWARPEVVAHDPILQFKSAYLNVPFFLARAVFYFATWLTLAFLLNRWSLEQDRTFDPVRAHRLEQLSRGGLVLYGLTVSFAAVDWAMSLEPHWFSTIYGVIFMGGQGLSSFAFVIPIAALLASRAPFTKVMTPAEFHDLGKLLLAFVMLWGYFAFSQFLIIWSGNLPEETPWYIRRTAGSWQLLTVVLVAFHFVLPFLVLLSRDLKRRASAVATVALVLMCMRFVDLYWLVQPAFGSEGVALHWLDLATLLAVGGLWLWYYVFQLKAHPVVPLNDPYLEEAA